ncbi:MULTISPECIES: SdiA-regulated domain-containing protein [Cupriavidus]
MLALSACGSDSPSSSSPTTPGAPNASVTAPALSFTAPQNTFELENYYPTGNYKLPVGTGANLLASEASGVTYNKDTGTLFVIGDGGTSIVQVTKQGALIDSMQLAADATKPAGTYFYDTEGIAWVGGNKFVLVEERFRQVDQFSYVPNTVLDGTGAKTVKLGTTIGNIGLEGISYDPMTGGYLLAKEKQPIGLFQTTIDFTAGTASNGSPTTDNSVDLFDPTKTGLSSHNDVYAMANILPASAPDYDNLLVISGPDGEVVKVDRTGTIHSSLPVGSAAQNEGVAMDPAGNLYAVGEKGDGTGPALSVFAPTQDKSAVGVGSNLYLTFAQDVTAGTGNIILSNGAGDVRSIPVRDAQVTISGKVVKINPAVDLAPGSKYSITYAEGVFGGAPAIPDTAAVSFTTVGEADHTAPQLASTTPSDDATSVAVNAAISLNFNETVRMGKGDIVIESAGDTRTIPVTDTAQVKFSGSSVIITPSTPLQNSINYDVRIAAGVILDTSGNAFAGISSPTAFNFSTASLTPAVPTVLISEVNSNENTPNGVDFFEIYNYGTVPADLSGWKWSDDHATATDANNFELFPSNTVIPAGGRLVVVNTADATAFNAAWGLDATTTVLTMGSKGIGLGKGDMVVLFDQSGKVATAFNYKGSAVTATQGDGSTASVAPSVPAAGVTFTAASHAGSAFGGSSSASAVWDGVSTSAPAYKAAVVGELNAYAAPGDATDIGSPGK